MIMLPSEMLAEYIRQRGPIKMVRVSSAPAVGKHYYWGAAVYEIRVGKIGHPVSVAIRGARTDRRSKDLAEADARKLAKELGAVRLQTIGRLSEYDCLDALCSLRHPSAEEAEEALRFYEKELEVVLFRSKVENIATGEAVRRLMTEGEKGLNTWKALRELASRKV